MLFNKGEFVSEWEWDWKKIIPIYGSLLICCTFGALIYPPQKQEICVE